MTGTTQSSAAVRKHAMPFGAEILPEGRGVRFRLWAPTARSVDLVLDRSLYKMQPEGKGWYSLTSAKAKAGSKYKFRIDGDLQVPDPASRYQPEDVFGPSMVVDPAAYEWRDEHWKGRPWEETVLYELHTGTFSEQGTFKGVQQKLEYLTELGITAIELMPVADFPGRRNWGYDGVLLFAPDSSYGKPEELKDLVNAAHQKGLMVFLDVVYNHFGPEGNFLHAYAKSFFNEQHHTPWGAAINFDAPGKEVVREFFIHNAMYWLEEYHIDGLRFDAVHAIIDDSPTHILDELSGRIRNHFGPDRHIHLVLENDHNQARFLRGPQDGSYNAQWNDDSHHAVHVAVTGEASGYYSDYAAPVTGRPAVHYLARCLAEGFAYQGEPSPYRDGEKRGESSRNLPLSAFVDFMQNHDQIGNRAFGERLTTLAPPHTLRAAATVFLLAPSIPLLYMGEEWGSKTPFLFFCNFSDELAPLVTEGRRKEFAHFPDFSNPENLEKIPDPSDPKTFERSRLDWKDLDVPEHRQWLDFYRGLLAVRQREIVPRLAGMPDSETGRNRYEVLDDTGLHAEWTLGDGSRLVLLANLGPERLTFPFAEIHNFKLIFVSEENAADALHTGQLPGWSAIWLLKP